MLLLCRESCETIQYGDDASVAGVALGRRRTGGRRCSRGQRRFGGGRCRCVAGRTRRGGRWGSFGERLDRTCHASVFHPQPAFLSGPSWHLDDGVVGYAAPGDDFSLRAGQEDVDEAVISAWPYSAVGVPGRTYHCGFTAESRRSRRSQGYSRHWRGRRDGGGDRLNLRHNGIAFCIAR